MNAGKLTITIDGSMFDVVLFAKSIYEALGLLHEYQRKHNQDELGFYGITRAH